MKLKACLAAAITAATFVLTPVASATPASAKEATCRDAVEQTATDLWLAGLPVPSREWQKLRAQVQNLLNGSIGADFRKAMERDLALLDAGCAP
ncbi:hypothetical protein [Saccharothrix syringae]|uniref:Uncharacterized protein n=1 Tax=Saccharothrix syringae TaxID=103733 RepID=A0A5Q0H2H1_SACSY|nr:hypothetical protein [Saccharothrix syringae]QFZ20020.1 hypothetical protein EKG83_23660 [Saccharothrix syringae]